jgi:hypothetical protein
MTVAPTPHAPGTDGTMPPLFDPPYESPIEEAFAWDIVKHLSDEVRFEKQVEIATRFSNFRIDFVAYVGNLSIGFECDGEEFHDAFRDECRDALVLGEGCLDAVYRIRGKDIHHHLIDCLYVISRWDQLLVSDRGRVNLERLASADAKRCCEPMTESVLIRYQDTAFCVVVERRAREIPDGERRQWQFLHQYATRNNVANVDQLVEMRQHDIKIASTPH